MRPGSKSLKKFAYVALALGGAVAVIVGCRGSVDRVYDDDLTSPEGGLEAGATEGKEHGEGGAPLSNAPATIRVTVGGLRGSGLVLQNNGDDDLPIPTDGSYPFVTQVPPGQPYKVTVANQPIGPSQSCTVVKGEGTAAGSDVLINVDCVTASYPVGGIVVGLGDGKSVTLQNNGINDIVLNADGPFTFPGVGSGNPFSVTIKTGTSDPSCTVSGGTGTVGSAPVDSVVVNCGSNTFTVGGTVAGLAGTLVVTNNGGDARTISANGSFAFPTPIANGTTYDVKVKTPPAYPPQTQTCAIVNGTGAVAAANVTNVAINCAANKYTVGGTVNGLTGAGLKLQNKGTDDKSINPPGGSFTFAAQVPSGSSYNVTIVTQPAGQTCSVTSPSGTIASSAISNVVVTCTKPIPLEEHFDTTEEPKLPTGWTSQALINPGESIANKWETISDVGDYKSAPNSAFIENIGDSRDVALVSPAFIVGSATAKLTFWNHYYTEEDWDGGVLEIAIAGGAWQDIVTAGGSFNSGGYDLKLLNDGSCTLGGRLAWNGHKTVTTSVNLPAAASGKSVQLRWRWASDDGASEDGWWIDDVVVTN